MTALSDSPLWSFACRAYEDGLPLILGSIVSAYQQRRPELENLIGVHRSAISVVGYTTLREALPTQHPDSFHLLEGSANKLTPLHRNNCLYILVHPERASCAAWALAVETY